MENLDVVELKQEELQEIEGGQGGRPGGNGYRGPGAFSQEDVLGVIESIGDWCCLWM